jgi:hypothetical protein
MNGMSGANVENCIEGVVRLDVSRGLIVKRKWLEYILAGVKTWEMRSRKTNIRGKIGLIESGTGLVKGTVEIVDCLEPLEESDYAISLCNHWVGDYELLRKWKYPWVLRNAQTLPEPIPYNHPQGAVTWVNL